MAKPIVSRTDILIIPSNSSIQCSTFLPAMSYEVGEKIREKKLSKRDGEWEREKKKKRGREKEGESK